MKKIILVFLVIGNLIAQEEQQIKQIRAEYALLKNAISTFQRDSTAAPDSVLLDGDAFYYQDQQKNIRLVELRLQRTDGRQHHEYYFKNNKLFFVYKEIQAYNAPFWMTDEIFKQQGNELYDPQKTKIFENRFYFHENKLIRWLNPEKKQVAKDMPAFLNEEKKILDAVTLLFETFDLKIKNKK
ncbi:hypothetical protein JW964_09300 [candidate division KSB1 bacterium]|nr:hypothetical protein [candidate division KSB1 bacterium]